MWDLEKKDRRKIKYEKSFDDGYELETYTVRLGATGFAGFIRALHKWVNGGRSEIHIPIGQSGLMAPIVTLVVQYQYDNKREELKELINKLYNAIEE